MTMDYFRHIMEIVGTGIDGVGVFVIIGGALLATVGLVLRGLRNTGNYYALYRQDVGRAILLGLEFLIAGDIIRMVVVAPHDTKRAGVGINRSHPHVPQSVIAIGD